MHIADDVIETDETDRPINNTRLKHVDLNDPDQAWWLRVLMKDQANRSWWRSATAVTDEQIAEYAEVFRKILKSMLGQMWIHKIRRMGDTVILPIAFQHEQSAPSVKSLVENWLIPSLVAGWTGIICLDGVIYVVRRDRKCEWRPARAIWDADTLFNEIKDEL